MNYPLISEYVEAIKLAEDNLDQLSHLRPVLDADGRPVMSSGNFAVVFKMKNEHDDKYYALKCFIKEQPGRNEAYKLIAKEMESVTSDYLTSIKFLPKEIFVNSSNSDETEFPVLLMDWVEGVTLDKYVREHLNDQYALQLIFYQFGQMASWLLEQPFAHGDLKPDNILVKNNGSIVLVDYDGMYVPAMKGQLARELGSPDFRHPSRTIDDFDEHIDDFSLATIAIQLYAISLQPDLLVNAVGDTLLLTEEDYQKVSKSETIQHLFDLIEDEVFSKLMGLFFIAYSRSNALNGKLSSVFRVNLPELELTTNYTTDEYSNGVEDADGAIYSPDKKRLFELLVGTNTYCVQEGTIVICDDAFRYKKELNSIIIPNTVQRIGERAFQDCIGLTSITIPDSVTHIGNDAFFGCENLKSITIPSSVTNIGHGLFSGCRALKRIVVSDNNLVFDSREESNAIIHTASNTLVAGCSITIIPESVVQIGDYAFSGSKDLCKITIPNSVTHIGEAAFSACESLSSLIIPESVTNIGKGITKACNNLKSIYVERTNLIFDSREKCNAIIHTASNTLVAGCTETIIPKSVTQIGDLAFSGMKDLMKIEIPGPVTLIGNGAFQNCRSITSISLPKTLTQIGDYAFSGCKNLTSLSIPNDVKYIGHHSFSYCSKIKSLSIPNSVTFLGESAFSYCNGISNITIPESVSKINDRTFNSCGNLTSVMLPQSVTKIGESAFSHCHMLEYVLIPDSVSQIGRYAFSDCKNLKNITIPNQLTQIDKHVFANCKSLSRVSIPNSITFIGDYAFYSCENLLGVDIPNSVTRIGEDAFRNCKSLQKIIIPNSVTHIGRSAFSCCNKLKSIVLPNSIVTIDKWAFDFIYTSIIYIPIGTYDKYKKLLGTDFHNKLVEKDIEFI